MRIFLSHAAANRDLARVLADDLDTRGAGTFVASRAGDIRADDQWQTQIEEALQSVDAYLVLLTPESINRVWVNFEAGAGWFSGKPLLFVRISNLSTDDIPLPISSRQIYNLEEADEYRAILQALGLRSEDIDEPVRSIIATAGEYVNAGNLEPAWEGVTIRGNYYAWAGPLLGLEDRDPVAPPAGLVDELKNRGLRIRWARHDYLPRHFERGWDQVFATDCKSWRRPVQQRLGLLLVRQ